MAYIYVGAATLDPALVCSICKDPYKSPVRHALCQNFFCGSCALKAQACPLCHQPMRNDVVDDVPRELLDALEVLPVKCLNCADVVARGDFSAHVMNDCVVECEHGCGQKVPRSRVSEHNGVCTHVLVRCPASSVGCTGLFARHKLAEHERLCPHVQIKPMLESFSAHVRASQLAYATRVVATHESFMVRVLAAERTVRQLSFHLQSGKKPIFIKEHAHPLSEYTSPADLKPAYEGRYTCRLCHDSFDNGKVFHCDTCNGAFDCCPACLHVRSFSSGGSASPRDSTRELMQRSPTFPGALHRSPSSNSGIFGRSRPSSAGASLLPAVPSATAL